MNNARRIQIEEAEKIRKEYKKGLTIDQLIIDYEANKKSIIKILTHQIYPTEITDELKTLIRNKYGIENLVKELKTYNKEMREAEQLEKELGLNPGEWKELTIDELIEQKANIKISKTRYVIDRQKAIKKQYKKIIKHNSKTVDKLIKAEKIRKARNRGKKIDELAKKYEISEREVINIIQHTVLSTKMTDELLNKISNKIAPEYGEKIEYQAQINDIERRARAEAKRIIDKNKNILLLHKAKE